MHRGSATQLSQVLPGRWEMGVTHLVLPKLVRNVQVLGAMASGGWLLSWDFLLACERSHAWLEPVRPILSWRLMYSVWQAGGTCFSMALLPVSADSTRAVYPPDHVQSTLAQSSAVAAQGP